MKSLLPVNIVRNLHGFRFIGNRAVHELEAPDKSELGLAIDVIEDLLNFLYSLDYKASILGKLKAAQARTAAAAPEASLTEAQAEVGERKPAEEA